MHTPDHELPSRLRSKGQLLKCFSIEINPYHTNLIIWPIFHHSKLFTTCASKISGPLIKFQCNCLHTVNATMDHQAKALQVSHGQTPPSNRTSYLFSKPQPCFMPNLHAHLLPHLAPMIKIIPQLWSYPSKKCNNN